MQRQCQHTWYLEKVNELANALNKVTNENIDVDDVKPTLKGLGIYLPEEELQEALASIPLDNEGKVNLKDCLTQLMKIPYFTQVSKKNDLLKALTAIRKNKVTPDDIGSMMKSIGVSLPQDMIQRSLENVAITGSGVDDSTLDTFLGNMKMEMSADKKVNKKNGIKDRRSSIADGRVEPNKLMNKAKAVTGETVAVRDLDKILGNMGFEDTKGDFREIKRKLPVYAKGKTGLKTSMDSVQITELRDDDHDLDSVLENTAIIHTAEELNDITPDIPVDGEVDVNDMRKVPRNMGIKFKDKKHEELVNSLPVDGGKVHVNNLDSILGEMRIKLPEKEQKKQTGNLLLNGEIIDVDKVDTPLQYMGMKLSGEETDGLTHDLPVDGKKVQVSDLEKVLGSMGIKLTEKELKKLQETLTVDAAGNVFQNAILEGVKSTKGGGVKVNNLDTVLENLGIKLTQNEHEGVTENLPFNGGEVNVSDIPSLLEKMGIELTDKGYSKLKKYLPVDGGIVDVAQLDTALKNMGMSLTGMGSSDLIKNLPVDDEKADSNDLKNFLGSMGIELTDQEEAELLKTLPVDAAGKVHPNRLLKGVKSLNGGKVHVNNLDNALKKLGLELTEEELTKLSKNLQVDANGMVGLKEVMDGVKATTGGEVHVKDVKASPKNMGIEFTDKEHLKLLKNLPFNDDNKVFKNRLLDGAKSLKAGKVDMNNLSTILNNLGIKLADTELKDLAENMHVGVDEKIPLETLMENITDFTGEKIESSDLKNVLENLGIELRDEELEKLLRTLPVDANGKFYHNRLLKALKSLKNGKIKKNNLHTSLGNMGMELTEEELAELSENLQVDANGYVDLHNVMEGIKAITGKVDIKNLETVLSNMGIQLTDRELEDLKGNLPVSVDNKVTLKNLKDELKAFTGEKVDSSDLQNILKDLGIEVTDKEHRRLLKTLPLDANGKVFQNRLLKDVKYNKRGKVDVNNLDPVLEAMDMRLTEKELSLLKDLLGASKKVDLKTLMDNVEAITGEEIDVNDMETVLGNMGIELTDKELSQLVKNLQVDNGKIYQRRLLDGIKFLKGGKIDSSKVDEVLRNMGMDLTENELKDVMQNLPVNVKGKVDLEKLMNEVKSFTGDKVDANRLESVLKDLGVELTPNEHLNLLKTLPLDAHEKVYKKRLMKGIKSLKRGSVDVKKLDTLLENMGISITEEEFMDLIERLPDDDQGKVQLNTLMEELSSSLGKQVDISDMDSALKEMNVEVTDKECFNLVKNLPVDAEGKVYQKRLLEGVKALKRGKVAMNNLVPFLGYMGIKLSHEELEDFSQNLPVDGDGKVYLKDVTMKMKDFTGEKIDARDLKNILGDKGIEVSDKECLELQKLLPADDDKKIFQNRLLSALKSFKGGKIDANSLNTVLGSMGIKLKNKELKNVIQNQPLDADGNVSLKKVMSDVKAVTGERVNVKDLKNMLEDIGIEFTPKEYLELVKNLQVDDDGNIYENRLLDCLKSFNSGKVDVSDLENILEKMKIKFPENKLKDLSQNLPTDASGMADLHKLLKEIKKFTGGKVDAKDLHKVLGDMGIELTDGELGQLLKTLPITGR
ncbi:uncharacterized protein LOC115281646 [Suricata suricatta]|uniref:uncharacterized protein LOC115281646 n=1 Tax=Suricata suricatta TaxID=37032 RepID=UPI0011556D1E|nr:uncharacterized protein LOC115281646 [Suricata suricatta]